MLNRNGWRIECLGANTRLDDLIRMAHTQRPDLIVLLGIRSERFDGLTDDPVTAAEQMPTPLLHPHPNSQ